MKKIRVAVLFGGVSSEHEISLLSAKNIISNLDPEKYEIIKIGIEKTGQWKWHQESDHLFNSSDPKTISLKPSPHEIIITSQETEGKMGMTDTQKNMGKIDVFFPVLHGGYGENGAIQGIFEIFEKAFVGPDLRASALCFDKDLAKRLLKAEGIEVAEGMTLIQGEPADPQKIAEKFDFPLFVKPSRAGSSVGVSKVKTLSELEKAIVEALKHDDKVLIEKAVVGREIECAVLGNRNSLRASIPAEVIPSGGHEFYDYDAKYIDDHGAILEVPANISEAEKKKIQETTLAVARTLGIEGMSRVDGFLTKEGKWIINEINTIPGFTNISLYPKMWEASGISQSELVDELIRLALERYNRRKHSS